MKRIRSTDGFRSRLFRWIAGALMVITQGAWAQAPVGAEGQVSSGELADYTLLYDLNIPNNLGTGPSGRPPYTTDNSGSVTPGSFDRIAYYMELNNGNGPRFIWVSMDAFTSNPGKIGVPTQLSGAVFQQKVNNMNVESNVPGIVTGTGIATGSIEFWPYNYLTDVVLPGIGGNSSTYDINDKILPVTNGYGSMQIHNWSAGQTLLAYNDWGGNPTLPFDDVGIGNNTLVNSFDNRVHPDWTFSRNAGNYPVKILRVYVNGQRQDTTPPVISLNDPSGPVTVECHIGSLADPGATAVDACDGQVAVSASNDVNVDAVGSYTITYTATDASGNSASASRIVNVVDTTKPTISLAVSPASLWPPNHKMVKVATGISAADVCDPNPVVTIAVTSNEPVDGLGDGDTAPDWEVANNEVSVRAERSGKGTGRIYTITVTATDVSGNTATSIQMVAVAPNKGKSSKLAAVPTSFGLHANYPNPFNPSTMLSYDLVETAEVRLTIYNVMGQQVRELVAGVQEAGSYQVQWDGRDGGGQLVANGLYLYRLQAGDQVAVQKMLFAK